MKKLGLVVAVLVLFSVLAVGIAAAASLPGGMEASARPRHQSVAALSRFEDDDARRKQPPAPVIIGSEQP